MSEDTMRRDVTNGLTLMVLLIALSQVSLIALAAATARLLP